MLTKPKTFSINQIRFRCLKVGDCLRFDRDPFKLWFLNVGDLYEIVATDKDRARLEIITNSGKPLVIVFDQPIWGTNYYAADIFSPIFVKRKIK